MMRDVIERFRYRFELWRRERREDLFGTPRSGPAGERDYASHFSDPKRAVLLTEPTLHSIGRSGVVYFCIIAIAAQICVVIVRFIPTAGFALGIGFLVFVGIWTLVMILGEVDLRKARKQYRQQATKSSNQSLQLTADRRDDQPSIHETAFIPKLPRSRQR